MICQLEPGPWVRHMSLVVAQTILNSIIGLLTAAASLWRSMGSRARGLQ